MYAISSAYVLHTIMANIILIIIIAIIILTNVSRIIEQNLAVVATSMVQLQIKLYSNFALHRMIRKNEELFHCKFLGAYITFTAYYYHPLERHAII